MTDTTLASDLSTRRCRPCEGGVPPLPPDAVSGFLKALHPDWVLSTDGRWISRHFEFPGFARVMGFVNAVAWIAESEGHHPELEAGYGRCTVRWSTHAVNGLTENDFICAARVDRLLD
ncbi:MAG: 4a-hydroxytetrahydrobiopterin dehydratase [Gammaproteobacteria bacterium]|nr:4a-hydroxytetrahydrobiopterin dehydratase [Gammaproteobacteria bacterium]